MVSLVTESASRKAFSSSPTMRSVAARPASSLSRSPQLRLFILSTTLLAARTTFWMRSVTMDSLAFRLAVLWIS